MRSRVNVGRRRVKLHHKVGPSQLVLCVVQNHHAGGRTVTRKTKEIAVLNNVRLLFVFS